MRGKKISAIVMALFMVLSLLPTSVFAADMVVLGGELKLKEYIAIGDILNADYEKVLPQGLTDEDVSFLWQRKTADDEFLEAAGEIVELKELGKEKTYQVTQEDLGHKIVLTITGLEERGFSGSLSVTSSAVLETLPPEAAGEAAGMDQGITEEIIQEEIPMENVPTEDLVIPDETLNQEGELIPEEEWVIQDYAEGTDGEVIDDYTEDSGDGAGDTAMDGIPVATGDDTWQEEIVIELPSAGDSGENAGTEEYVEDVYDETAGDGAGDTAMDGIPVATTDEEAADNAGTAETYTYSAQAYAGESGILDFGIVPSGEESTVDSQFVTIVNTGTGVLNFEGISPEHFMVQDIVEPLAAGAGVDLWIVPREGIAAGVYEDTITYVTLEGATASFTAKVEIQDAIDIPSDSDDELTPADELNGEGELTPVDGLNGKEELIPDDGNGTDDEIDAAGEGDAGDGGAGDGDVPVPVNPLTADVESLEFTSSDARTVVITNTTDNDITVNVGTTTYVTVSAAGDFVLPAVIPAGSTLSLVVTPVAGTVKGSADVISVTDTANSSNAVSIPVTVNVDWPVTPAPDVFVGTVTPDQFTFETVQEGYATAESREFTLTSAPESTIDVEITAPVSNIEDSNFVISEYSGLVTDDALNLMDALIKNTSATFTVSPKTGLSAGTYTETFTIHDMDGNVIDTFTVTFTVEQATRHELTVEPSELIFGSAEAGYGEVTAQKITVKNTGNVTEVLKQPAANNYVVEATGSLEVAAGSSVTFNVYPKSGLGEGTYNGAIAVESDSVKTQFTVSFIVSRQTNKLVGIQQPTEIKGLASGTRKDASSLKLPSTVMIETTQGYMKAAVSWDVKNCAYKASSTEAQSFTVNGIVTLPNGVQNPNNVSLATVIRVGVNAYSPKIVSAADNKISGLTIDKSYTTQARISFTAVGAGMDNSSPRSGDTRYVPLTWTVINTNSWKAAPYTATFGLAQSGNYSLTVVFGYQRYNGSSWADTGERDTKVVNFRVASNTGEADVPGVTITPAANQKNAVDTGDTTMIIPFVIALIVAAGAAVAIIIFRKKK